MKPPPSSSSVSLFLSLYLCLSNTKWWISSRLAICRSLHIRNANRFGTSNADEGSRWSSPPSCIPDVGLLLNTPQINLLLFLTGKHIYIILAFLFIRAPMSYKDQRLELTPLKKKKEKLYQVQKNRIYYRTDTDGLDWLQWGVPN